MWNILIIWLWLSVVATGQEIIKSPQDKTVFLNQIGVFTCETYGDFSGWKVNGSSYINLSPEVRDDLKTDQEGIGANKTLTLNVTARAIYNGTFVQCVTGRYDHNTLESEIVILTIQGLLTSVLSLEIDGGRSSINVTWGAPFTLDVTDEDPDIWYSVFIYNVTDEENPTTVPCTNCHNITQTHYIFIPDYPTPCHKYTFSVIPHNGVGEGETSQNVTGYTINKLHPDVELEITRIEIDETKRDQCKVQLFTLGDLESVCGYTLKDDNDLAISVEYPVNSDDEFLYFTLPADREYSHFEIYNAAGTKTISGTNFTTYDIQNITTEVISSDIIMTVQFISNSLALGCIVVLEPDDGSPDEFRVLQWSASHPTMTEIISVPPSTYTVYVYDLEQDGHINEMPAILPDDRIHITTTTISTFLKRAELSRRGSEVTVRCEFADEYPEASCVLVYRKYNTRHVKVNEYRRSTEFPVTLSINDSEMYTFAVFGKNGEDGIEPEPVVILKNKSHVTYPQPQTCEDVMVSNQFFEGVGVGIVVGIVTSSVTFVIALITVRIMAKYTKKAKGKKSVPMERNVAYELHHPQRQRLSTEQAHTSPDVKMSV